MGVWGTEVFEHDTALDVRGVFEAMMEQFNNICIATDLCLATFESELDAPEDYPVIYLALAAYQIAKYQAVCCKVYDAVIKIIDEEMDLKLWHDPEDIKNRSIVLRELENKLSDVKVIREPHARIRMKKNLIPTNYSVYLLVEGDRVVYVGRTIMPERRELEHKNRPGRPGTWTMKVLNSNEISEILGE